MTLVLVDTSVWIPYLRLGRGLGCDELDLLLAEDRVALCGMVELELLQGLRQHERRRLLPLLGAVHFIETGRQVFVSAGETLSALLRKGISVPASDGLIAALCLRWGLPLLAADAHFDHFPDLTRHPAAAA